MSWASWGGSVKSAGGGCARMMDGGDGNEGGGLVGAGGVAGGGTTLRSGSWMSGEAGGSSSWGVAAEAAGPGVGVRPSRKAFAISAAFHLAYLIFSSIAGRSMAVFWLSKVRRISRKLAAARNLRAVFLGRGTECVCSSERSRWNRCSLCDLSAPVLVICTGKDAKGKVLDIGSTCRLVMNGIVWADIVLELLQET